MSMRKKSVFVASPSSSLEGAGESSGASPAGIRAGIAAASFKRRQSVPPNATPGQSKTGHAAAQKRLEEHKEALAAAGMQYTEQLGELLGPAHLLLPDDAWKTLEIGVRGAFEALQRRATEQLADLSNADADGARELLKEQAAAHELKLEHARTAATVKLKDQSVALEASYHKQMEDRMTELTAGGENALFEATRKVDELSKELKEVCMHACTRTMAACRYRMPCTSPHSVSRAHRPPAPTHECVLGVVPPCTSSCACV